MRSGRKTKVRLRHRDTWRTVLTDTAPFEVPIIVSNDGFYKNLGDYSKKSQHYQKLIDALVLAERGYTIPLKYNIIKSADSLRTLSLLHPTGQVSLAKFYQKYDQLICEYGGGSPFSIRKPTQIGRQYFFNSPVADKNKYKNASVDTAEIDSLVRNPASYFAYFGFDRLYRFFLSDDHVRLEKKFVYQHALDIGKCFDSIYTHSIAWAVKSKELAKESTAASTFGNDFDKVMQQLNYNETSGICIGPECSRIFAEIILAKVDQNVVDQLSKLKKPLKIREDYECRRYVDNYYLYANSNETLETIEHELSLALREYKLHINDSKTERAMRPFYTRKSLVVDKVDLSLKQLWSTTLSSEYHEGKKLEFPKRIFRDRSLFGHFTREIKAACFASEMGYDAVSNYVIGAVKNKILQLADTFTLARDAGKDDIFSPRYYREMMLFLLDVGFYFFTLHPTVASSLRLSHAIVRCAQHMEDHDREGFEIVKEATLRWTALLARSPTFSKLYEKSAVVPIEILNVLLSLQQFSSDGKLEAEIIDKMHLDGPEIGYFQTVVKLYIFADSAAMISRKIALFERARIKILGSNNLIKNAELSHLLLDLLACPYIDAQLRQKLLCDVWPILLSFDNTLGPMTNHIAASVVAEVESQHWFVRWRGVDLLSMIEKKELSAVYS